jgi:uncharacterized protein YjbI with pentapeptide repeats
VPLIGVPLECLMGVYFTGVHLIGVYLIGVYFIGGCLMGVYLVGLYLTGVHLIGVHLIACTSLVCTLWACTSLEFENWVLTLSLPNFRRNHSPKLPQEAGGSTPLVRVQTGVHSRHIRRRPLRSIKYKLGRLCKGHSVGNILLSSLHPLRSR